MSKTGHRKTYIIFFMKEEEEKKEGKEEKKEGKRKEGRKEEEEEGRKGVMGYSQKGVQCQVVHGLLHLAPPFLCPLPTPHRQIQTLIT